MFNLNHTGTFAAALMGLAAASSTAQADQLIVAGFFSDSLTRFDAASGQFVDALQAPPGMLDGPLAARVGPDGLLYVASEAANAVIRFNLKTRQFIDVFVAAGSGGLNGPTGVTWGPDGHLYVSGFNSDNVLRYDGQTGAFLGVFVPTGSGGLNGPDNGTIFGPDGHLYVPSYWTNRIMKFNGSTGAFMSNFVPTIGRPRVLEFRGPSLYVTSETADAVLKFDAATGASQGAFIAPGAGGLDEPIGLAFDESDRVYVTSGTQDQVLRYNAATGAFVDVFVAGSAHGLDGPVFVTFTAEGCRQASCPADITFNCVVNVDDLLGVINGWGPCSAVPECPADVAPKGGGDGTVDVDDLLMLISGWGDCGP